LKENTIGLKINLQMVSQFTLALQTKNTRSKAAIEALGGKEREGKGHGAYPSKIISER